MEDLINLEYVDEIQKEEVADGVEIVRYANVLCQVLKCCPKK